MTGSFLLNGRMIRNRILAYGRRRMLETALMNIPAESAWYIGLLSDVDSTKIADNHTYADKNWTEFTDYRVGSDNGVRPTWTPLDYTEQTIDYIVQYTPQTLVYTGTASKVIRGLFLCDRIYKDDVEFNIFSIAEAAVSETVYPGQSIEVGYTVAYQ